MDVTPELLQLLSELDDDDELDELLAGSGAGAGSPPSSAPPSSGRPTRNSPPHSGSAVPSAGGLYGSDLPLDNQVAMLVGALHLHAA
eukprot:3263629-Pyramimonas_sp.AAC.1